MNTAKGLVFEACNWLILGRAVFCGAPKALPICKKVSVGQQPGALPAAKTGHPDTRAGDEQLAALPAATLGFAVGERLGCVAVEQHAPRPRVRHLLARATARRRRCHRQGAPCQFGAKKWLISSETLS